MVGQKKNYTGMHFWAPGYFPSTVGADEATNVNYIRNQDDENKRLDQLIFFAER
jgi:putative transposase